MIVEENDISTVASTGIKGLDKILRGGLPRNRIYLLEGNPGTGKTTIALQFLLEGRRQGEQGLYITLSETKEELIAVARSHGWSLDGITLVDLAVPEDLLVEDQYTLYHPSEVELGVTTKGIFEEVERLQPQRVVFDSLSEMRLLAHDPLRYRRQILAIKQFFIKRHSTILLLDDHTSRESDRQLESLAHGVLTLEHISPGYGGIRRQLTVVKLRGVNFISGHHDFKISTGGVEVFPRLTASDHYIPFERERFSSNIANLDALTGGGLITGTTTLLIGPAGSGKSSLATQYVISIMEKGHKAALFVFDENASILLDRSAGLGMDLARQVEAGRCLIRQVDPAELTPGEFSDIVCKAVEEDDVKMVVIDSLNGYNQSMPEEKFLMAHMHEMLAYLNQKGVLTILVVAQNGLLGPYVQPPVDLSYLADVVVMLRFFENAGRVYKAISVIKKRIGTHEDTIRELRFTADGLQVGNTLDEFHGVLSGVPQYIGKPGSLMDAGDDNGKFRY